MPDNDNILIEIKSAFEKSGTDAAERAQDNLKRKTEDTNKTFRENERAVNSAQKALGGLTAASAASQGSFGGLSRVLENFSGRLADLATKATLVAGAFAAGYGIGTAVDKWLGISKAVADAYAPMEKIASIQDRIKAQLSDLNGASLAAVKSQFDALADSLNSTMSQLDRTNAVKNRLLGAEGEAQIAEIEASMPPGPARDRAILAKKYEREQLGIQERYKQASTKQDRSLLAVTNAEAAVAPLETAVGERRKRMEWDRSFGASPEQMAEHRIRLQAAQADLDAARAKVANLREVHGKTVFETDSEMRALALEDRTSKARFAAGGNELTRREQEDAARKQEEAARLAARQLANRETLSNEMRDIGVGATRVALSSQLGDLGERREQLSHQGMSAARVADLRAKAAGTYKQADSAVAAVAQVLDSITARMKSLEDKLKNLPR
jgi:hypothetical protein